MEDMTPEGSIYFDMSDEDRAMWWWTSKFYGFDAAFDMIKKWEVITV